jgi:dUTP pyrophosphatase
MKLGFKKVHPDAKLPSYAHVGDAGMDVCSVEDVELRPFTPTLVKTGLIAEIPLGYEIQVRPRSGLALKQGVTVFNTPGTVDAGYRAEIGIILIWSPQSIVYNSNLDGKTRVFEYIPRNKEEEFHKTIHKGDRIAQLVLAPVTKAEVVEVTEVSDTERGTGGFGSTGV